MLFYIASGENCIYTFYHKKVSPIIDSVCYKFLNFEGS